MVEVTVHVAGGPALLYVSFWNYSARSGRGCSRSDAFVQVMSPWTFLCTHLDWLMCSSWDSCICRNGGVFEFSTVYSFWFDSELQIERNTFIQQNNTVWCALLLLRLQVFWNCKKFYFLGAFSCFLEHVQAIPFSSLSILLLQEEEWIYITSPLIQKKVSCNLLSRTLNSFIFSFCADTNTCALLNKIIRAKKKRPSCLL